MKHLKQNSDREASGVLSLEECRLMRVHEALMNESPAGCSPWLQGTPAELYEQITFQRNMSFPPSPIIEMRIGEQRG